MLVHFTQAVDFLLLAKYCITVHSGACDLLHSTTAMAAPVQMKT